MSDLLSKLQNAYNSSDEDESDSSSQHKEKQAIPKN